MGKDRVGHSESIKKSVFFSDDVENSLIGDNNEGIDLFFQFLNPLFGLDHPAGAFKKKGFGDDGDSQGTDFFGNGGNDGGGTSAGTAAFTGGNKNHVGAGEQIADFIAAFFGGSGPDFRICSRPQTLGHSLTDLEFDISIIGEKRLEVGVDGDKLNALDLAIGNHGIKSIVSPTADPENFDFGKRINIRFD